MFDGVCLKISPENPGHSTSGHCTWVHLGVSWMRGPKIMRCPTVMCPWSFISWLQENHQFYHLKMGHFHSYVKQPEDRFPTGLYFHCLITKRPANTHDFMHPLSLKNAFCAKLWSKTATQSCENEAFVRDFDQKLQLEVVKTKLSCEVSLLWDFFAVSFLCCETHRRSIDFYINFLW